MLEYVGRWLLCGEGEGTLGKESLKAWETPKLNALENNVIFGAPLLLLIGTIYLHGDLNWDLWKEAENVLLVIYR